MGWTLKRIVLLGERYPRGYGLAYPCWDQPAYGCYPTAYVGYPIPLNWLAAYGMRLLVWLRIPPAAKRLIGLYDQGFQAGRQDGLEQGKVEGTKLILRHFGMREDLLSSPVMQEIIREALSGRQHPCASSTWDPASQQPPAASSHPLDRLARGDA